MREARRATTKSAVTSRKSLPTRFWRSMTPGTKPGFVTRWSTSTCRPRRPRNRWPASKRSWAAAPARTASSSTCHAPIRSLTWTSARSSACKAVGSPVTGPSARSMRYFRDRSGVWRSSGGAHPNARSTAAGSRGRWSAQRVLEPGLAQPKAIQVRDQDVGGEQDDEGGHRRHVELPRAAGKPSTEGPRDRFARLHHHLRDRMPGVHPEEAEKDPDQDEDDAEHEGIADDGDQRGQDVARLDEDTERVEDDDADQERKIEAARRGDDASDRGQVPLGRQQDDPSRLRVEHAGKPGEDRPHDQDENEDRDQRAEQVAQAPEHRRLVYGVLDKSRLRISDGGAAPAGRPSGRRAASWVPAAARRGPPGPPRRARATASPSPRRERRRLGRAGAPSATPACLPAGRSAAGGRHRPGTAGLPGRAGSRGSPGRLARSAPGPGRPARCP